MKWTILRVFAAAVALAGTLCAEPLVFPARTRKVTELGATVTVKTARWEPEKTALIVCDFWDSHNCWNAVKRVEEMAPRLAEVVAEARKRGVFIIHAPSDCMAHYEGHPARLRAQQAPKAAAVPEGIGQWQYWKNDEEKRAGYPIDADDGGNDDTEEEKAEWNRRLEAEGRRATKWPWRGEHPAVKIDGERDAISDRGEEIWNLLEARGIRQVLFTGVHANMCVCGRSFGLRQLARHGREPVLLRDLTDTMYNPTQRPQVSHFRGTELIVGHIERFICPTALSSEVLGGTAFTFSGDSRPTVAAMIGEDEYRTSETLPAFLEREIGARALIRYLVPPEDAPGDFADLAALRKASTLLVSVRRRTLPTADLDAVRGFVRRGGHVIGLRTASHAFALRSGDPPPGRAVWPEFDAEVLGGHYHDHWDKNLPTTVWTADERPASGAASVLLKDIPANGFASAGSLYKTAPVAADGHVLMTGLVPPASTSEPVTWFRTLPAGNRVFYTSLGHPGDFSGPVLPNLLRNAVEWTLAK